jgi:putative transposase
MVECNDQALNFKKRCELLGVSRGSMYYNPKKKKTDDAVIIQELRNIYAEKPFYGYRKMVVELRKKGFLINHKAVQRLLQIAGMKAIYPTKKTTHRNLQHKVYPYLLRGLKIERPNQVWQVDITYIKIRGGFVYLVCLIDVFSRKIMGWSLSTFLDVASCLHALENALKNGTPEIINSDQGCQFTSEVWIASLKNGEILISMDGKGRWADNVFVERLWRTIKYELIYLHSFETVQQVRIALERYITFYNQERFHQVLNYHTPDYVFAAKIIPTKQELFACFVTATSL